MHQVTNIDWHKLTQLKLICILSYWLFLYDADTQKWFEVVSFKYKFKANLEFLTEKIVVTMQRESG